jgi:CRISPR-associated protein Csx16
VAATTEEMKSVMRLISFLGKGDKDGKYHDTTYALDGHECRTNYVAHALARLLNPCDIHVIATEEAWGHHGGPLSALLSSNALPPPNRVHVPTGGTPQQLWDMFGAIVESLRTSDGSVLLDITHGFRMQPFFAAACIQYVQAVMPNPPDIRVVYGEYRGANEPSPIWELTPFLDVLSWSRNLMMFLQTGQADAVVEPTERLARDLSKQWAVSGRQGAQPQLRRLSTALQEFSDNFTTIRTGSLLVGDASSSHRLAAAIDETQSEVMHHLPALALILQQVKEMVMPLQCNARLSAPAGQRTLVALARLYESMGRYSEAISVLREGWITLNAPRTTDEPGSKEFVLADRKEREKNWNAKEAPSVAEIRNDIQHAGFQKQPLQKKALTEQLASLLTAWLSAINASEEST